LFCFFDMKSFNLKENFPAGSVNDDGIMASSEMLGKNKEESAWLERAGNETGGNGEEGEMSDSWEKESLKLFGSAAGAEKVLFQNLFQTGPSSTSLPLNSFEI